MPSFVVRCQTWAWPRTPGRKQHLQPLGPNGAFAHWSATTFMKWASSFPVLLPPRSGFSETSFERFLDAYLALLFVSTNIFSMWAGCPSGLPSDSFSMSMLRVDHDVDHPWRQDDALAGGQVCKPLAAVQELCRREVFEVLSCVSWVAR